MSVVVVVVEGRPIIAPPPPHQGDVAGVEVCEAVDVLGRVDVVLEVGVVDEVHDPVHVELVVEDDAVVHELFSDGTSNGIQLLKDNPDTKLLSSVCEKDEDGQEEALTYKSR